MTLKQLKKDSDLFFQKYEKIKNIEGVVSEAEALSILSCSSSTLRRWRKRLGVRQFMGGYYPVYARKDIELIKLHRQFGTLIKKLRSL